MKKADFKTIIVKDIEGNDVVSSFFLGIYSGRNNEGIGEAAASPFLMCNTMKTEQST